MKNNNSDIFNTVSQESALTTICKSFFKIDSERISVHTLNTQAELEKFCNDWREANNSGMTLEKKNRK